MELKLTDEQMISVKNEDVLIVCEEEWEYIEQDDKEEDEDGAYNSFIYKRPSDNKFFRIGVVYCRYGHKDYGYEDYMQNKTAYEVEKKEITITKWVSV